MQAVLREILNLLRTRLRSPAGTSVFAATRTSGGVSTLIASGAGKRAECYGVLFSVLNTAAAAKIVNLQTTIGSTFDFAVINVPATTGAVHIFIPFPRPVLADVVQSIDLEVESGFTGTATATLFGREVTL